jgi:two-component system response regulator YesN
MKILVVDDNELVALLVQEVLEGQNHMTKTAGDGESGYSLYLDFEPDVVISDIHMPKKNGLQLIKAILKHNPRTKVVLMTGSNGMYETAALYRVRILRKPFSWIELLGILNNLE